MNASVLLISPDPEQRRAWRVALHQDDLAASEFASFGEARAALEHDTVVVVAIDAAQQVDQLQPGHDALGAGIAVAVANSAPIAAAALRAGVDCLLASDPLFDVALRQRVTSEINLLTTRRQLADAQLRMQRALREVGLAAQTQSRFRPVSPFVSGGIVAQHRVVAAGQLSGDCVDYFRLADGRFVFYVADVAGHGLSAALLTPLLKSFSLQLARGLEHTALSTLIANFGADVAALKCGKHVTLFAGIVSADETTLRFCSAGHAPPPMLSGAGETKLLTGSGKPLGLFADVHYVEIEVPLPAEFTLAAFSDGVLDLVPGADLSSRHVGLVELLHDTGNNLEALAQRLGLVDGREFRDDIECLLLHRGAPQ